MAILARLEIVATAAALFGCGTFAATDPADAGGAADGAARLTCSGGDPSVLACATFDVEPAGWMREGASRELMSLEPTEGADGNAFVVRVGDPAAPGTQRARYAWRPGAGFVPSRLRVEADVRVRAAPASSVQVIALTFEEIGEEYAVVVVFHDGRILLSEYDATTREATFHSSAEPVTADWRRIELDVSTTAGTASLSVDGKIVDSGPLRASPRMTSLHALTVGLLYLDGRGATDAVEVAFDGVRLSQ